MENKAHLSNHPAVINNQTNSDFSEISSSFQSQKGFQDIPVKPGISAVCKMKSFICCGLITTVLIIFTVRSTQGLLDYQQKCELPAPNTTTTTTTAPTRGSNTAFVDPADPCDYRKYLECRNTTNYVSYCQCQLLNNGSVALFYMNEKSSCVSPPQGPCWKRFHDGNFELPCSRNAECIQSDLTKAGFCECLDGFSYQPETGGCVVSHNGPCSSTADCDIYSHLICSIDNKCVCGERSEWTGTDCIGLVGGHCEDGQKPKNCIENAHCDTTLIPTGCLCNPGYQEGSDFRCYKTHNQTCNPGASEKECHENFECLPVGENNFCLCPADHDLSEDDDQLRCLGRSGATCKLDAENPDTSFCHPHSTCTNTTANPDDPLTCECDDGYSPDSTNNDNMCRGKFGTSCQMNGTDVCNEALKLVCSEEGDCTCKAFHDYNTRLDICVGYVGQECTGGEDCITTVCNTENRCGCPDMSVPNTNGTKCMAYYGAACTDAESPLVCNPDFFLGCLNATCNCLDTGEFVRVGESQNCSVKAGVSCDGRTDRCVPWSFCQPSTGGGLTCQCINGYSSRFDGQCALRSSAGKAFGWSLLSCILLVLVTFLSNHGTQ